MSAPPRIDRASRPMRTCSAVGCHRSVPAHLLMCMDHWRMVPAKLARAVTQAWHVRDRGNAQTLAYQAAVAAAVKAVAEKQLARGTLVVPGADISGDLFDFPARMGHEQLSKQELNHASTSRRDVAAGGGERDQCTGGLRGSGAAAGSGAGQGG